jgi:hypothetical protein
MRRGSVLLAAHRTSPLLVRQLERRKMDRWILGQSLLGKRAAAEVLVIHNALGSQPIIAFYSMLAVSRIKEMFSKAALRGIGFDRKHRSMNLMINLGTMGRILL